MKIGGRSLDTIVSATLERRHYVSLWNMLNGTPRPLRTLAKYLTGKGSYPTRMKVSTPTGTIEPTLYSHHDLLTINEIFFRRDYECPADTRVAVDLGSNIGISALFFLSLNPASRCYLFEPVPANVIRLKANLAGLEDRYVLGECAVGVQGGEVEFGVEETGRYGGIGVATGRSIRVPCRPLDAVLGEVIAREGFIDVLKIDTEGSEAALIEAIRPEHRARIGRIFAETPTFSANLAGSFDASRFGPIVRYVNRDPGYRTQGQTSSSPAAT